MLISYQHVLLTLTFGLPEVRDKVLVDTLYVSLSSIGKTHQHGSQDSGKPANPVNNLEFEV